MELKKMSGLVEKYGAELKNKLLDPVFFINEVIGFDKPPYKLTPYQEEWIRLVEENKRVNMMAFRSSGKSEVLLIDYPIFKAFTQPKWQGILVSNSLKQSTSLMRRIREKIMQNEILRTSVPGDRSSMWSKTEIQLKNLSMIWSRPNNDNLPGEHVDYIGGDEIGYWKDANIITKTIPPMTRAKDGTIVFIGTPTSQIDMIHQLSKNEAYYSSVYPADKKIIVDGKETTLWDVRYPKVPMEEAKKEYDSISWSREFLCKPLSSEDKLFPYELVAKAFDQDSIFHYTKQGHKAYFIGLDFALSGEAGSDYTVITVLERDNDVLSIVNIERYKGLSYQAQKLRIKQLTTLYQPVKVVADEGSFGKSFLQDLLVERIPIQGFRFTNQSKQDLVTNMRNMFEQDKLIIPRSPEDNKAKPMIDLLLNELDNFGVVYTPNKGITFEGLGEHDDMVISLGLALWAARSIGNIKYTIARGRGNSGGGSVLSLGRVN